VPERWLASQRVGHCTVSIGASFVDVLDADFLATYERHPRIRRAIDRHLGHQYDLDVATILLNLQLGRPVTQAVAAELWSEEAEHAGIRYVSRLDITEECFAVFSRTDVVFDHVAPLNPSVDAHRDALLSAAATLGLVLPSSWS
jgi:hypothetical protein